MTPRESLFQFFDAMNRRDLDAIVALLHPDYIEDYPQSGERIRGPRSVRSILENYPGGIGEAMENPVFHGREKEWVITPAYTVVNVTDNGNMGTGVFKVRYADGNVWWMIALFEIRDDLIYRQTAYFAQPFEAPEWRAQWVEPIE